MAVTPFFSLRNLVLNKCNNFLLPGSSRDKCYKFLLDGYFVGFIHPMFLDWLLKYANVFVKISHPQHGDHCITVHQAMINVNDRSNAVAEVMQDLRTTSPFKALKGWRNEDYGVYVHNREKVLLKIERSASSLLGITRYGVHVNGFFSNRYNYSRKSDRIVNGSSRNSNDSNSLAQIGPDNVFMWLGLRSINKPTSPGMLDNMAAGGLTYGLDVMECARKECQEEASVPEHMLGKLTLVNQISYIFEDERGVCPQIEYCFDLELPPDFIPVSSDGEVDSFRLASISEIKQLIFDEHFKSNSAMVALDFLYRHKFIDKDSDPRHAEVQSLMHVNLPFD
ncbi:unnamed protein product [Schistosoma guineensis]|uniref:Nudix hydrolase 20, chloroplastic, variant 2 n=2 Tax=Schistosoma haematobium TaxID=6185 RepID=A0A922LIG3_SCHHA|nr:Nudix hydrolase 20, chloroplastic, variant 2 [Schistosoma haematobium]KAH9585757.1 Nudix hydrolase 20, chloroplastic, variant 2 [Schistosoma haematobium]CAH8517809.1 unnamed protein product [Schistosoma guineensis]CAH8526820.1 unnamed protein product [Schistosoma haematobium]CAH8529760.1 unnamed protein product [Schistosoma haematobium]